MTKVSSSIRALFGGLSVALLAAPSLGQTASVIEGVWLTPSQSEMTISSCVEGFCGYISRIVITDEIRARYGDEVDAVTNYTDYNNKNPALRDRPIHGLRILTLRAAAEPGHYEGEIYSPEDGNTYAGFIEVVGPDVIKLTGCAMMVLCQEQVWRRIGTAD